MKLSNKVNASIQKYLDISSHYVISIGVFYKGEHHLLTLNQNGEINDDFYFDIGSISKTFTAHLALKLHEENIIDINKDISEYLPLKKGNYPTIKELLSHQAGYHHLSPTKIIVPALIKHGYAKKNIYENIIDQDILKYIKIKPKSSHKYSCSDLPYAIVATIISKALNRPFGDIFYEFINKDLKLANTYLGYNCPRNLDGYIKDKKIDFWKWKNDNPYLSGGGIISTIKDMVNYIDLEINSKSNYIKNCHIPMGDYKHIVPCLGWHTYHHSYQLWHVGGVSTFRSSIIINKVKNFGVVVLGNAKGVKSGNVHYICKQIYSEIKRNKIKF